MGSKETNRLMQLMHASQQTNRLDFCDESRQLVQREAADNLLPRMQPSFQLESTGETPWMSMDRHEKWASQCGTMLTPWYQITQGGSEVSMQQSGDAADGGAEAAVCAFWNRGAVAFPSEKKSLPMFQEFKKVVEPRWPMMPPVHRLDQRDTPYEENKALLTEVCQLKELLEKGKKTAGVKLESVLTELYKSKNIGKKALQKIPHHEDALRAEREQLMEAERNLHQQMLQIAHLSEKKMALLSEAEQLRYLLEGPERVEGQELAQQMDQTNRLQGALAQANEDLESQAQQWEVEKFALLAKHQEDKSGLVARVVSTLLETQEERHKWQEERMNLLESLSRGKRTLERKESTNFSLMSRIGEMERNMDEVREMSKKMPGFRKRTSFPMLLRVAHK